MCLRSSAAVAGPRVGLIVLLGVVLTGGLAPGSAAAATSETTVPSDDVRTPVSLESNTIVIELNSTGDARWQVSWTYSLPEDGDIEEFRELATEFEQGRAEQLKTLSTVRNVSRQLNAELDRRIRVRDVERTGVTNATDSVGRLRLSFTWENFAAVDGDRLLIGDTLSTDEGLWLDGLAADQQLVIRVPTGYGVFDASVDVQDGALRWEGPLTFDESSLQATFVGNNGTDTPTPGPSGNSSLLGLGIAGAVLLVILGGGVFLFQYRDEPSSGDGPPVADEQPPADTAPPSGSAVAEQEPEGSGTGPTEIDEELLSDEERVERLLETNGGRMKQADIVDETDWSNAKVSQLLSAMEDDGRIDKLRIGRENLISFPDVDVTEIENDE